MSIEDFEAGSSNFFLKLCASLYSIRPHHPTPLEFSGKLGTFSFDGIPTMHVTRLLQLFEAHRLYQSLDRSSGIAWKANEPR